MTLTLDLPKSLEKKLIGEATAKGLPLEEYIVQVLSEAKKWPETPTEVLEYWEKEGLFHFLPARGDSAKVEKRKRKRAERRARK